MTAEKIREQGAGIEKAMELINSMEDSTAATKLVAALLGGVALTTAIEATAQLAELNENMQNFMKLHAKTGI